MENIILIETSTELCSAAIASDGKIISYKESTKPREHASLTAVFIGLAQEGKETAVTHKKSN